VPNVRATEAELYEGLFARSVNCWPGPVLDLLAANQALSGLLPAGFYYKTFMWPKWATHERLIRRSSGLGTAPREPDADVYDKCNAHCDVLVVGGGPAGLMAALAAGRAGARVLLADSGSELGGVLLHGRELIDGGPALEWVAGAVAELQAMPEVRLLSRSTVYGYHDHNFLTIVQRLTDHLPVSERGGPRERLWRVRPRRVVLATGAIERPLVFADNDRPGIMLASAVSAFVQRYAVRPGERAVLFTNNDGAYRTALALADAGVPVQAVVELRPRTTGALPGMVRDRGIRILEGHAIVGVAAALLRPLLLRGR